MPTVPSNLLRRTGPALALALLAALCPLAAGAAEPQVLLWTEILEVEDPPAAERASDPLYLASAYWTHVVSLANGDFLTVGTARGWGGNNPVPAAEDSPQPYAGDTDVLLARWSPTGGPPVWAAYVGGTQTEYPYQAVELADGRIAVVGSTSSSDFPVLAAPGVSDPAGVRVGINDGFLAVVDGADGRLAFSARIGTPGPDRATSVAQGRNGWLYVTGRFTTQESPDANLKGEGGGMDQGAGHRPGILDQYVRAYRPDGSRAWTAVPSWTAAGGSNLLPRIATGPDGAIYLTGWLEPGAELVTTPGAWQQEQPDPATRNGFVARLAAQGHRLDWVTWVGGSGEDVITSIATDDSGHVTVVGTTTSTDFPRVASAAPCAREGSEDLFAVRLRTDGARAAYATCLGGSGPDTSHVGAAESPFSSVVAPDGTLTLVGRTTSPDFPSVRPWQESHDYVSGDGVVVRLAPDGTIARAGTIGGSLIDNPFGVAANRSGVVAVAGQTQSPDFGGWERDPDTAVTMGARSLVAAHAFLTALCLDDGGCADPVGTPSPTVTASPSASTTPSTEPSEGRREPTREPATSATPAASASSSASPSASAMSAAGSSPPTGDDGQPCEVGTLRALDPAVVTGQAARLRYQGPAGTRVAVEGYSRRPGETPTYARLRAPVVVPDSGEVTWVLRPGTNTRVRAVTDCGTTASAVVAVAARPTLTARRVGAGRYELTGTVAPGFDGRRVTVTYRVGGGEVRKAVAALSGGRWSAQARFTGRGRLVLLARSNGDAYNTAGRSADVAVHVH